MQFIHKEIWGTFSESWIQALMANVRWSLIMPPSVNSAKLRPIMVYKALTIPDSTKDTSFHKKSQLWHVVIVSPDCHGLVDRLWNSKLSPRMHPFQLSQFLWNNASLGHYYLWINHPNKVHFKLVLWETLHACATIHLIWLCLLQNSNWVYLCILYLIQLST